MWQGHHAVRMLAIDSLGVISFAALMAFGVPVIVATAAGVATAVLVIAWQIWRRKKVPALQWVSLALVTISAGATLVTHDPRFVMAKPTLLYAVVGITMLQRGWMNRYLPANLTGHNAATVIFFGYAWAGLMVFTAVANLVVAVEFTAWWVVFIGVFPLASKFVLCAVQYLTIRAEVIRFRREAAAGVKLPGFGRSAVSPRS